MHLDQYRIAIRERSYVDILDLALQLTRAHLGPLVGALALGVIPAMLLGAWLTADFELTDEEPFVSPEYVMTMLALVFWLAPLATAPATLLLGQLLFNERPQPRRIAFDLLRSLPQLIWYQVILRAFMMAAMITIIIPIAIWPYMSEVILLERNRFISRTADTMTTQRRLGALHSGFAGDLFGRAIAAGAVVLLLTVSIGGSLTALAGLLSASTDLATWAARLFFPLALWIVVSFFAIVRFLGYLDLRIRREGWEVELLMRAEGARLTQRLT